MAGDGSEAGKLLKVIIKNGFFSSFRAKELSKKGQTHFSEVIVEKMLKYFLILSLFLSATGRRIFNWIWKNKQTKE